MSEKKSRPHVINNETYSFINKDGELLGITKKDANGIFKPLDNSSVEFNNVKDSEESLDAFRKAVYGGDKNSYPDSIEIASDEELTNYFAESQKKFNNEQFVENEATSANAFQRLQDQRDRLNKVNTGRGRSEGSSQILAYPSDFDRGQDHLKITRHEYRRPDVNMSKSGNVTRVDNNTSQEYNTAGDTVAGTLLGSVLLPMPKVADVNGVEWGNSELTISGLAALGLARGASEGGLSGILGTGKDAIAKLKDAEALEDIKDDGVNIAGSNVSEFTRALKAQTLSGLAGILPGVNLDADTFLARTSGRVLNPNAEVLFQGPVIRDFAFSFIMIARSEKEGAEIRKILRFLKEGMAPKFRSTAFLENPDVFLLEYRNKGGVLKTVNRFNPGGLALQTMSVDYAPNGYWSAYRDSQPVALKLNLSFKELRPIYQGDQLMTPSDSVGY